MTWTNAAPGERVADCLYRRRLLAVNERTPQNAQLSLQQNLALLLIPINIDR